MAIATRPKCRHCSGNLFFTDEDGQSRCALCNRPYHDFRDYGRLGGLQTALRHGREHMAEIGKHGGLAGRLPTIAELRQQTVPQIQLKEERLPNRLTELKALWKERWGEHEAANSSPRRG